jgi:hypothetical protein
VVGKDEGIERRDGEGGGGRGGGGEGRGGGGKVWVIEGRMIVGLKVGMREGGGGGGVAA